MNSETECRCDCRKRLVTRLAAAFGPTRWNSDQGSVSIEDAAGWLSVEHEDVQVLIACGLLAANAERERIKLEDILSFVKESDWLEQRAAQQLTYLAECVARRKQYESAISCE